MKHFKAYEIVDRETYERLGEEDSFALFKPIVLQTLDDLWEFFNIEYHKIYGAEKASITVNNWKWGGKNQWRGLRTPEKAKELGSPNSRHKMGDAFDCTIKGFTAEKARQLIIRNKDNPLLVNITRLEDKVSWLHWDMKPLVNGQERIYLFKP